MDQVSACLLAILFRLQELRFYCDTFTKQTVLVSLFESSEEGHLNKLISRYIYFYASSLILPLGHLGFRSSLCLSVHVFVSNFAPPTYKMPHLKFEW